MRCQYCDEDVKDAALVCRYCGQNLTLTTPLVRRIAELEAEASELRAENIELLEKDDELQAFRLRRAQALVWKKEQTSSSTRTARIAAVSLGGVIAALGFWDMRVRISWFDWRYTELVLALSLAWAAIPVIAGFTDGLRLPGRRLRRYTMDGFVFAAIALIVDAIVFFSPPEVGPLEPLIAGATALFLSLTGALVGDLTKRVRGGEPARPVRLRFVDELSSHGQRSPLAQTNAARFARMGQFLQAVSPLLTFAAAIGGGFLTYLGAKK